MKTQRFLTGEVCLVRFAVWRSSEPILYASEVRGPWYQRTAHWAL